jgi:hypothetical protein
MKNTLLASLLIFGAPLFACNASDVQAATHAIAASTAKPAAKPAPQAPKTVPVSPGGGSAPAPRRPAPAMPAHLFM